MKAKRKQLLYIDEGDFYKRPLGFMRRNVVIAPGQPTQGKIVGGLGRIKIIKLTQQLLNGHNFGVWQATWIDPSKKKEGMKAYFCGYIETRSVSAFLESKARLLMTAPMDGCTFAVGSLLSGNRLRVTHINKSNIAVQMIKEKRKELGPNFTDKDAERITKEVAAHVDDPQWRSQQQERIQANAASKIHKGNLQLIEGHDYLVDPKLKKLDKNTQQILEHKNVDPESLSASAETSTFGVLRKGKWFFYTHRYRRAKLVGFRTFNAMQLEGVVEHFSGPVMPRYITDKEEKDWLREEEIWEDDKKEKSEEEWVTDEEG